MGVSSPRGSISVSVVVSVVVSVSVTVPSGF